jgi:hypothetical protein
MPGTGSKLRQARTVHLLSTEESRHTRTMEHDPKARTPGRKRPARHDAFDHRTGARDAGESSAGIR